MQYFFIYELIYYKNNYINKLFLIIKYLINIIKIFNE